MEPRISVTFDCSGPYELALLARLYQLLCDEGGAGREEAKDLLCENCYARLRAEVEGAFPDYLAGVLGERDATAIQSPGSEN
jgi:hypothetical protein